MKTTKELLRDRIKHLRDIRSGKKQQGLPNINDVPDEMKPYVKDMEDIGQILGPITSTKPIAPTKKAPEPPKKVFQVNHQTVYQQWQKTSPETDTTPSKTLSFFMSKIPVPSILEKKTQADV